MAARGVFRRRERRACGRPIEGAAHREQRHRHARPAAVAGQVLERHRGGDLRGAVRVGLPQPAAGARAAHCRCAAGGFARRQDLDHQGQAGHPVHARPGVSRQAARTHRRRLRLLDQAFARPEPARRRRPAHLRPHRRYARAGRCGRQARRALRLRRAGRGPACARPLHAADQAARGQLPDCHGAADGPRLSRGKSSRRRKATSSRAPSAPGRTCCANGSAARA